MLAWLEKQGEQKVSYTTIVETGNGGINALVTREITNGCDDEPKSDEWSEEDEKMCQETIDWFEKKCFPYALESENPARESIKWLKSLKQRIGG
jgi:hypothetical protein